MEQNIFRREGNNVFSVKTGKLVAVIGDDGTAQIQKCMHSYADRLKEFLTSPELPAQESKLPAQESKLPEMAENPEFADMLPEDECAKVQKQQEPEFIINSIPLDQLPPFDKSLGTKTPGFEEFVKKHKLNKEQRIALVRRLEQNN